MVLNRHNLKQGKQKNEIQLIRKTKKGNQNGRKARTLSTQFAQKKIYNSKDENKVVLIYFLTSFLMPLPLNDGFQKWERISWCSKTEKFIVLPFQSIWC